MNLDEQIGYFSRRTPGHLKGIVHADCPELGLGNGGHGEQIAIGYRLRCTCGNEFFKVSAYSWNEVHISPVSAECSQCGSKCTIFDSELHGYDPVACGTSSSAHGEREEAAYKSCLSSLSDPRTVEIVTYYPDDLFDEDFDEFAERRADLFTWIRIIIGEDANPNYPMLDFECS
ncbi:MAG: hypothetical protein ABJM43_09085 [Paracoccaceae bacterium]